ncbi:MAG: AAA family ATPase [Clostridia bacterium]|nr:AAA family ATPase [Clostridia bacterium]
MTDKLKQIVIAHIKKYPEAELQDILKMLYQNEFGPKHLAENEIECFKSLSNEINNINYDESEELFEDIGEGALRLNLKAIPVGTDLNYINKLIVNSANDFCGTNEKLVVKFGLLVVMAQNNEIPFDIQKVRDETNAFAKNGFKPISHSEVYKERYSPSYRVISKKYRELVEAVIALRNVDFTKKHIVISIDGNSASGKSTLAENLANLLNAETVHCDDFFLPQEMRSKERLNEVGGNIHYERLKEEVIDKLRKPTVISYKAYNCQSGDFKNKFLMNKKVIIIEGAYSSHPYFENYADFKIFLKVDEETQRERILKRNGEEMLKRFINEWIPKENKYFNEFKIEEKADIIIRSV